MKYKPGDSVHLKSQGWEDPWFTVLAGHEEVVLDDQAKPERYDLAMVARDGSGLFTTCLPVFVLVGEDEAESLS